MDDKEGVEAFCNHLVNEFGYVPSILHVKNLFIMINHNKICNNHRLESMLFLIEVTQFKAIIRRLSLSKQLSTPYIKYSPCKVNVANNDHQ